MNRNEIIRMAKEAGWQNTAILQADLRALERFAALVAEAEREDCADICDQYSDIREINTAMGVAALNCAELIRARGDA